MKMAVAVFVPTLVLLAVSDDGYNREEDASVRCQGLMMRL
jgi:hypothetical protein